jgi:hypothetical protein
MKKAIELAKKITINIGIDNTELLESYNFHKVFESILETTEPHLIKNTLIAAIIYGYDNDSKWIDTRLDGITNNKNILKGLNADFKNPTLIEFIHLQHDPSLECIGNFLDRLPDWRFRHIRRLLDSYTTTMNQASPDVSEVDAEKVAMVFVNWGKAMESAKRQMYDSQEMLKEIERDYLATNSKTESDFGEQFTTKTLQMFEEENTKRDAMSWNQYVRTVVIPKRKNPPIV